MFWHSIRCIRRSLPHEALAMLVTSFITSEVDYCNVAFAKLARCELDRIQSVLNVAARLTAGARKFDNVTPCSRIYTGSVYQSASSTSYAFLCTAASMVQNQRPSWFVHCRTWSRVVGCVQRPRQKFWCRPHVVQPSVTAPSLSPILEPGTVCLQICDSSGPFLFLNVIQSTTF